MKNDKLCKLLSMGYNQNISSLALNKCNNNVELAIQYILNIKDGKKQESIESLVKDEYSTIEAKKALSMNMNDFKYVLY